MSTTSNAELDVTSIRVQKLIEKIEDGAIKVPELQSRLRVESISMTY